MQDKNEQLAPWRVLVLYKSARYARRDKHTPAPQANESEKSKAERSRSRPLSRLGVRPLYPLGGVLDIFRFWPFVVPPPGEIVSPRIITISFRLRFIQ